VKEGVEALPRHDRAVLDRRAGPRDPAARGSALYPKPNMASLSTGSVIFPTIIDENRTTLVEDLA
jgi:hypothetical protein